jgi:hypothetical protein
MRPYETYLFRRLTDLIIINGPLLTNFSLLRARFLACIRFIRFFLISILRSPASRAFYVFVTSFSVCLAAFSRASFSRVNRTFSCLTDLFFFITSRAFPSCIIACYSFYLPPYVIIDVLSLPARLHVHTPEQLLQP